MALWDVEVKALDDRYEGQATRQTDGRKVEALAKSDVDCDNALKSKIATVLEMESKAKTYTLDDTKI